MDNAPFAVALGTMLGLAALAGRIGLAAIIGAFLAGMVFAEAREHFELEHQAPPVYRFLVPFFFVITGSQVDWRLFVSPNLMALAAGVTVLAGHTRQVCRVRPGPLAGQPDRATAQPDVEDPADRLPDMWFPYA